MSLGASDFLTDEELEELGEDGHSHITYVSDSDKKVRKKKTLSKPPLSPRSPYLTSASLNPRRSVASTWRTALSQSPLKGHYELAQSRGPMCGSTPEYLKEAFGMRRPKHSRSATNGYVPGTPDYKEKEEMYDELLELKKTLQAQKVDGDRMKAKLRRLEEDNTKKEKQIEQLLDPTRGPEFTRSLVDKKTDGKSVVHGLKQKVLRLEQQCREKETALSKLQSELRTTNMEEMKITMETYYEEVQRLRALLESVDKSNKIESTENRRQQKVLRATALKLTKSVKQLEEENARLKEEAEQEVSIVTESPANRAKGYMEWSRQRLVRRLLDTERRLEEVRNRHTAKDSTATKSAEDSRLITTATRPEDGAVTGTSAPERRETVSVSTETDRSASAAGDGGGVVVGELRQECVRLKGVVRRLREERSGLQESLAKREEELRGVATEREEAAKEAEKMLRERTAEHEKQAQQYREEIQNLSAKIRDLQNQLQEEKKLTLVHDSNQVQEDPSSEGPSSSSAAVNDEEQSRREQAAKVIQTHWHAHRIRDIVLIQSALRSHLSRQKHLLTLRKQTSATHSNNTQSNQWQDGPGVRRPSASRDGLEEEEVTLLQSVFRGHLRRRTHIADRVAVEREAGAAVAAVKGTPPPPLSSSSSSSSPSSSSSVTPAASAPSVMHTPAAQHSLRPQPEGSEDEEIEEEIAEEDADDDYSSHNASFKPPKITVESDHKQAGGNCDSDDSDDIIVSPSRPMGRRMSLLF